MRTRLFWSFWVIMLAGMVIGIIALVSTASNDSAKAQQARVTACSHVNPPSSRGACVEGKPAVVIRTIRVPVGRTRVVIKRVFPQYTYTTNGLIRLCEKCAKQDASNIQSLVNWGGVQIQSIANGLGECLNGIGNLTTTGVGN